LRFRAPTLFDRCWKMPPGFRLVRDSTSKDCNRNRGEDERALPRYCKERKEAVVRKMLPSHSRSL